MGRVRYAYLSGVRILPLVVAVEDLTGVEGHLGPGLVQLAVLGLW